MQLIIAEKPSVAQSIAAVLGVKSRRDGYLEGGGYLVSWCLGHLAGLAPADAYGPAYSKWELAGLPILPGAWKYTLSPEKRGQFDVLAALMAREDVESLVCATDAGREGELIFRQEKRRVALMPTSQAALALHRAASNRRSYAAPGRRASKPARMAASSMLEIHSREKGFWQPASW